MYYSSDNYFTTCRLINDYIGEECKGFYEIKNRMEEITCSISRSTRDYDNFVYLQEWIVKMQK